jgi:hypothetical protein
LGLKALDRLSNVTPVRAPGATNIGGKGHRANRSSGNLFNFGKQAQASSSGGSSPMGEKDGLSEKKAGMGAREGRAKRKKAIAAVIVDQLGSAVGQVALKNSRFNRQQDYGSLESARKLAKKLFMRLNDVMPPRAHLIVDDFRPYFSSDAEAVRFITSWSISILLISISSKLRLHCSIRMASKSLIPVCFFIACLTTIQWRS